MKLSALPLALFAIVLIACSQDTGTLSGAGSNTLPRRTPRPDLAATAVSIAATHTALQESVDPTPTAQLPTPTATATPIPGIVIGQATIEGSGQSGNIYQGQFSAVELPERLADRTLSLLLTAPLNLPDGREQTLVRMTHVPDSGRYNYIELPTAQGIVRLYLHPEGSLVVQEFEAPLQGVNILTPDETGIVFSTQIDFELGSDPGTYLFRFADTGLEPMVVVATLLLSE